MFKKITSALFLILFFSNAVFADEKNTQAETWNSEEGLKKLERSQCKNDFYQLANFYQPQINPLYCSVATGVILLNALNYGNISSNEKFEIHKPQSDGGDVIAFNLYSQETFFNEQTDKIKKREIINYKEAKKKVFQDNEFKEIYDAGLSLSDFSEILSKVYKLKTQLTYAKNNDAKSLMKFRETAKKVLSDDKSFLVVNFDGRILGQKTSGHISPLAAFDEEGDAVLVMDVALHKNQWYWISVPKLFEAMNSKDDNMYRGYLVVGH